MVNIMESKLCIKIMKGLLMKLTAGELDLSEVVGLIEALFDENTVVLSESEMYYLLQNIIKDEYYSLCEKYVNLDMPECLDDIIDIISIEDYLNDRLYVEAMRAGLYRDYFDETECMMVYVEGEYYYVMFKEMI